MNVTQIGDVRCYLYECYSGRWREGAPAAYWGWGVLIWAKAWSSGCWWFDTILLKRRKHGKWSSWWRLWLVWSPISNLVSFTLETYLHSFLLCEMLCTNNLNERLELRHHNWLLSLPSVGNSTYLHCHRLRLLNWAESKTWKFCFFREIERQQCGNNQRTTTESFPKKQKKPEFFKFYSMC